VEPLTNPVPTTIIWKAALPAATDDEGNKPFEVEIVGVAAAVTENATRLDTAPPGLVTVIKAVPANEAND
jgi:hypothetical protein